MVDIESFVSEARAKGLDDVQIKSALSAEGWDAAVIDAALLGLVVPRIESTTPVSSSLQPKQPSLSHLMAALHHVLLWFFVGSSTVTIVGVVASLSGFSVSSQVLASMIAVTLITFTPYAILFLFFLIKSRRTPGLIPGKVWSIITICLHSVGAMAAAITVVITIILSGESNVLLSASLILALNLIVVTTYCFAAFGSMRFTRMRQIVIIAHLPVLLLLFGTLFVMSVLQLEPAKHDEQLRKDLAQTVQKVNSHAQSDKALPKNADGIITNSEITYAQKTATNYEVCATFKTGSKGYTDTYGSSVQPKSDSYATESDFYASGSGRHCFEFTSSSLGEDKSWLY